MSALNIYRLYKDFVRLFYNILEYTTILLYSIKILLESYNNIVSLRNNIAKLYKYC